MKFIRGKDGYWLIAISDIAAMDRHDRNVVHCALKEIEKELGKFERTTDSPILLWQEVESLLTPGGPAKT